MAKFQDPSYLASDQYRDAGNLEARIQLHERFSTNEYGWFRWVFDQLALPPKASILEVGCGSGRLWFENHERIPAGWQVTLTDLSPGMAKSCRKSLVDMLGEFSIGAGNLMKLPFQAAAFDAVVANHMLYHVPDRPHALAEISRVLRPGGCLYAATNGDNHLLELDELVKKIYKTTDGWFLPKPFGGFTLENGRVQLAAWFKQVEVRIYEDSLIVTEAEPLVAYIRSMMPRWSIQTGTTEECMLELAIKEIISQKGCIRIQKSSGLLIARN